MVGRTSLERERKKVCDTGWEYDMGNSHGGGDSARERENEQVASLVNIDPTVETPSGIPSFDTSANAPPRLRMGWTGPVVEAVNMKQTVLIQKSSLRFVRDEADPSHLLLQFDFTAMLPGTIEVYYLATDDHPKRSKQRSSFHFRETLPVRQTAFRFDVEDSTQSFIQRPPDVIIVISVDEAAMRRNVEEVSSFATFGSITKNGEDYEVQTVKRNIILKGQQFEMFEIYGLDRRGQSSDSECVICLTEERRILILPCRHLCLCEGCSQRFFLNQSNRCPVCRVRISQRMRISVGDVVDASATPEGSSNAPQPTPLEGSSRTAQSVENITPAAEGLRKSQPTGVSSGTRQAVENIPRPAEALRKSQLDEVASGAGPPDQSVRQSTNESTRL